MESLSVVARNEDGRVLTRPLCFDSDVEGRAFTRDSPHGAYEQPLVLPQVSHFRHVPLRTMVKFPHSEQLSPS